MNYFKDIMMDTYLEQEESVIDFPYFLKVSSNIRIYYKLQEQRDFKDGFFFYIGELLSSPI